MCTLLSVYLFHFIFISQIYFPSIYHLQMVLQEHLCYIELDLPDADRQRPGCVQVGLPCSRRKSFCFVSFLIIPLFNRLLLPSHSFQNDVCHRADPISSSPPSTHSLPALLFSLRHSIRSDPIRSDPTDWLCCRRVDFDGSDGQGQAETAL